MNAGTKTTPTASHAGRESDMTASTIPTGAARAGGPTSLTPAIVASATEQLADALVGHEAEELGARGGDGLGGLSRPAVAHDPHRPPQPRARLDRVGRPLVRDEAAEDEVVIAGIALEVEEAADLH